MQAYSNRKGRKLSIDITSSKEKSLGQNKYWLALMDEGTGMLWCEFLKSKDIKWFTAKYSVVINIHFI